MNKVFHDNTHLNSHTDQASKSWAIEFLALQLARANRKLKISIYLFYALAHAPLDERTLTLNGVAPGDKLYTVLLLMVGYCFDGLIRNY